MPQWTYGTLTIPYQVEEHSRRQYPAIQVDGERRVTVVVPTHFGEENIARLLNEKARWLMRHVTEHPQALQAPARQFVSGEGFLLRGHLRRLKVSTSNAEQPEVTQDGRLIRVNIPLASDLQPSRAVRDVLVTWYHFEAAQWLPQRVGHYAAIIGIATDRLKIAEYKSRWGFCREDGLIALNWRIIQAPLSVIDYVVVHELTHRRYPHHRSKFWQAVETELPDYEVRRQWLKDHGPELGW